MAIECKCNACNAVLQVQDSFAGKQGRCPHCKSKITVPTGASDPLTPECVVAEFRKRGKSAVLLLFDTPVDGNYALLENPDGTVKCVGSDDMSHEQLREVIKSVAALATADEKNAPSKSKDGVGAEPYELKGDRLGMALADFKMKYHRAIKSDTRTAPFTSEDTAGEENVSLLTLPWHANAGIVHCSIDYPFERFQGRPAPTVAGVATDFLIYKFVDGSLYQITAFFDTNAFEVVRSALIERYGNPDKEEKKPAFLFWWNGCSSVSLRRGRLNPSEYSHLHFTMDNLMAIVTARAPNRSEDL